MTTASLDAARRFVLREGRPLERRLLATLLDGADPAGVLDALLGYRNADGGFGHGLEPDKDAPESQPLDVELALRTMDAAGHVDGELASAACDFLTTLGAGVGCLTPAALGHPRAEHWGEWAVPPSLNPTAGIVALLWRWDVGHPWRAAATAFCWEQLERGLPGEAHAFGEALAFLAEAPDRDRAAALAAQLPAALAGLTMFNALPGADYGVTPLHYAPAPDSPWSGLFEPAAIDAHLEAMAAAQQPDGGWPIAWQAIGAAAERAWRGIETVRAVRTLRAYGRLA